MVVVLLDGSFNNYMKLLLSFIDPEVNFLLQQSKTLKKEFIFKDKTQTSILFHLKYKKMEILLLKSGMGSHFSISSLQKVIDNYKIDEILVFGSSGSIEKNIGKIVFIDKFSFLTDSFLYKDLIFEVDIKKYQNSFKEFETFQNFSADRVVTEEEFNNRDDISFDMEKSYIAYNLILNKIPFVLVNVITDNGKLNFKKIKKIYNSKTYELIKIIDYFLD